MDSKEFSLLRQRLQKTQKEMSQLLGVSLRSVQSAEKKERNGAEPVRWARHP